MRAKRMIELILVLTMLTSVASVAWGADESGPQQEEAIGQTPPRLSLTKGEVSFWRPGAEDWSQAQVNTPLAPGDQLYIGSQGNLEIQVGSRAFVRGGANTQLGFENHEPDFLQFKVTDGNASFDLRTVEPGRTVEVNTPNAVLTIEHEGYYRVDVLGERTSFITRRSGLATVTTADGQAVAIEPSEEVVVEGIENPQVASYAAPQLDEWDRWNYARTDHLLDAVSARYVSPGVYGVDDLDRYGTWRSVPTYGAIWVPRAVPAGWVPYSTGSWTYDPYYGWTWVDTEPWGWAPYHYGRWVFVNGYWAWAPGPVVVRPAYAPALVAFFGGPSVGINVRIGFGPTVGWVALGWGEPCVPWWGPSHIRHRAWWGGWGGPRVVNNVVINRTTVVNVQEINVYRNATVRNAVVAVNETHFGRGPVKPARVPHVDEKSLRPIHTPPAIAATPASFVPRESRGIRPPEKVIARPVVATRTPHPMRGASAQIERKTAPGRVPTPAPRIVSVPEKRETAPVLQRPPFGQSKVERRTSDRAQPPAPPKIQGQKRYEQPSGGTPSVTRETSSPKKGESQVTDTSPAKTPSPGRRPEADRTRPSAPPKFEGQKRPEQPSGGTPAVTRETSSPKKGESQVTGTSPAKTPSPGRRPEADRTRPSAPPKFESQKRPEQPSGGTPALTRQTPPPRQPESQVTGTSPSRPQSSGRQPEADRTRQSATPKFEGQRRPEQGFGGTPSVTRQTPPPRQREPQVVAPPQRPQAVGRPAEAARPPARVLPGEPANRLSPDRAKPGQQPQKGQESKRVVDQDEKAQKRQGN